MPPRVNQAMNSRNSQLPARWSDCAFARRPLPFSILTTTNASTGDVPATQLRIPPSSDRVRQRTLRQIFPTFIRRQNVFAFGADGQLTTPPPLTSLDGRTSWGRRLHAPTRCILVFTHASGGQGRAGFCASQLTI